MCNSIDNVIKYTIHVHLYKCRIFSSLLNHSHRKYLLMKVSKPETIFLTLSTSQILQS